MTSSKTRNIVLVEQSEFSIWVENAGARLQISKDSHTSTEIAQKSITTTW